MKSQGVAFLLVAFVASTAQASTHSQARLAGETFHDARARYLGERTDFPYGSAEDAARDWATLDQKLATPWDELGSMSAVTQAFEKIRDVRFMSQKDDPTFLRRITWLFPDDGCWARAASADLKYAEFNYPLPTKVFAFGDLGVKTPNAPGGEVGWWYHVAPVVSFKGTAYVLDPAVEPKRPLELKEWFSLISGGGEVTGSICAPGAYEPESTCADAKPTENNDGPGDEKDYLKAEWNRIKRLKRDPNQELGENPPWEH